ncbi:hypothetical protein H5410_042061 [Solanum commersonii]|uniref:Uncharacterized protein n=1 Tax=Solanum commersonii TaxID=4109 RepID=A0A9J5XT96_SOLCO|nr:hypothetical protein H5410_042061 [Solanum commersonii]
MAGGKSKDEGSSLKKGSRDNSPSSYVFCKGTYLPAVQGFSNSPRHSPGYAFKAQENPPKLSTPAEILYEEIKPPIRVIKIGLTKYMIIPENIRQQEEICKIEIPSFYANKRMLGISTIIQELAKQLFKRKCYMELLCKRSANDLFQFKGAKKSRYG